jgi:diacylglycerol kinase family enzyme
MQCSGIVAELSRLAVIRSPSSGSAVGAITLDQAFRQAGLAATIFDSPPADDRERLDRIVAENDVIVAAGGDGTVSTVAAAVARAGKRLAIIPAGTLNHFARDLGIPARIDEAIAIVRNGIERGIDCGVVNDRLFLNNVSLGNYPRMVNEREALERRGTSRTVAAALAVARTWWHLRKLTAILNVDGRELVRRSPFFVVGNGSYTLSGLALGKREHFNDGQLSLYVAPPDGRLGVLALPMRALFGTLERHEQFETFCARRIGAIFGHQRVTAAIDGEVRELQTPLEFGVRRGALRLLVPQA